MAEKKKANEMHKVAPSIVVIDMPVLFTIIRLILLLLLDISTIVQN